MAKRNALGKGLGALIPNIDADINNEINFFYCRVEEVVPSKLQPRQRFDRQKIEELSLSIKESGLIQPLVVRRHNGGYEIR